MNFQPSGPMPRRRNSTMSRCYRLLPALPLIAILSCTGEQTRTPEKKTAQQATSTLSEKAQWADMILRPTDSTRQDWIREMPGWPDPVVLATDSAGRAQISDLTFALYTWAFKNLDAAGDSMQGGLHLEISVAATHIPSHLLMKDFSVDSVRLFLPGQEEPAGCKKMFPSRRKFLQGVWQVQFLPAEPATIRLDFPEGARLKPRVFVSWRGKKIIFDAPPVMYEYTMSPQAMPR